MFARGTLAGILNIPERRKAKLTMATEERVLCFERKLLEELGVFQGISLDVEKYLPVVTSPSRILYMNLLQSWKLRKYCSYLKC